MATGPEHYREAERLLDYIDDGALQDGIRLDAAAATEIATRAQAHATLATAPPTPVDLSALRSLVERFDPSSDRSRSRAFKADLLHAIDDLSGGA